MVKEGRMKGRKDTGRAGRPAGQTAVDQSRTNGRMECRKIFVLFFYLNGSLLGIADT